MAQPRMTQQNLLVLKVFVENPRLRLAGVELMKRTGLPSGTLYPILLRFEGLGLLESEWEDADASALGRPRRRFYTITHSGAALCRSALTQLTGGIPFSSVVEAL